jgi:SAM-dependent methyltransferase
MHDTSLASGAYFALMYGKPGQTVVDVGGLDVNGSLRSYFEKGGMKYINIDIESHPSVDIVVKPGEKLPFDTGSIDLVVSTSCFEHDPCFWLTFREMCRIVKPNGYIYVNAPSDGKYHCHPGDNWRFYSDAGQALAYWASKQMYNEELYYVKVVETFHILKKDSIWTDFVCVWQRCEEKQTEITTPHNVRNTRGILEQCLINNQYRTINPFPGYPV